MINYTKETQKSLKWLKKGFKMEITLIGERKEPASTICISGLKITNLEYEIKNLILKQNIKDIKIKVED